MSLLCSPLERVKKSPGKLSLSQGPHVVQEKHSNIICPVRRDYKVLCSSAKTSNWPISPTLTISQMQSYTSTLPKSKGTYTKLSSVAEASLTRTEGVRENITMALSKTACHEILFQNLLLSLKLVKSSNHWKISSWTVMTKYRKQDWPEALEAASPRFLH